MIVKMIQNLKNKMEKIEESINKDLEEIKSKHTEKNNTLAEIKITLSSVMSHSLPPHGVQHARLLCPLQTPGACSNSCPLSQ